MRRPWCTSRATIGSSAGTPSQSRTAPAAALETAPDAAPRPAAPPRGPDGSFQRVLPAPRLVSLLLLPPSQLSRLLPPWQLSRLLPPALLSRLLPPARL